MAVLSTYKRYNGETAKLVGFASGNYIIDGTALNTGLVSINDQPVDIPGYQKEIVTSKSWGLWRLVSSTDAYWSNYSYEIINPDISSEVSAYGELQFIDPSDAGVSFVLSKRFTNSKTQLVKLDKNGNLLSNVENIPLHMAVFIDSSDEYIAIMGYDVGTSYPSIFFYKKSTLELLYKYSLSYMSYNSQIQLVKRDNNFLTFLCFNDSKPYYIDRTALNSSNKWTAYTKTGDGADLENVNYGNGLRTNFSKTMGNGWNYKLHNNVSGVGQELKLVAIKINSEEKTYETIDKDQVIMSFTPQCAEELKKLIRLDTSYIRSNIYELTKLSDDLLCLTVTVDPYNTPIGTIKNNTGAYWIIKVDKSDPKKVQVLNAQYFKYGYTGRPIVFNKDKILFVQEEVAVHSYKLNPVTYELELVWNVPTPNVVSVSFYNGYVWWINRITGELNYEVEANTLRAVDGYSQKSVDLDNLDTPKDVNYMLSIYDIDNKRVRKEVKLTINTDAMVFKSNSSKTLTTTTSDSDDIVIPIKCLSPAKGARIMVTVLN